MKRLTILKQIGTVSAVATAGAGSAAAEHETVEVGGIGPSDEAKDYCDASTCTECLDDPVCEDCRDYC